jgi:hypothetical protein
MATSDVCGGYILLSDTPGDARRVQLILAEWGVDKATIERMLRDERREVNRRSEPARDEAVDLPAGQRLEPVVH